MDINQAMQAVEQLMSEAVNSRVTTLRDASHHILEAGGKRFRPRIVLLSYAALGGQDVDYVAPVAAAIELVHTASVVHDDINDHGVVRRGRPSVNAIWGRTFALLTGDYLFTKVYELMAPYQDRNATLAEATVALVEGETLQASAAKEGNLSREIYLEIIALKTAALFKAAARLGGELAEGQAEHLEALANYGYNIGLAFQIVDDILDLIGDTEQLGKTAGLDVAQGKGVATAYSAANGTSHSAVAVAEDEEDLMTSIKRKVLQGDTITKAQAQARMLAQQAVEYIDTLPPSNAKDQLIDLANQVIEREY
ncbi:MAG: polyprenyl synthetase family protein [Anaerolineae bacterium]|nr:polyprenyl synthetase family protein [Anaerolineae bacterium]